MKTIYYTFTKGTQTGLYLDECGRVQTVHAANTPTAQPLTPLREPEEIEQRLQEIRPFGRFQLVLLAESDFWRKVSAIRPALTISEGESGMLNSLYSGVEN